MSAETFLSATANGVYQGTLVAILVGLVLRMVRTNAATRYAVWFGTLLLVTALIPVHLLLASLAHPAILPAATQPKPTLKAVTPAPSLTEAAALPTEDVAASPEPQANECAAGGIDTLLLCDVAEAHDEAPGGASISRDEPAILPAQNLLPSNEPSISKWPSWNFETSISLPHSICLGLLSVWVLIVAGRGALLARRLVDVRRLKASSRSASQGLQSLFHNLRGSLRTRRNVRLNISDTQRTAVVLGFIHPAVLLPGEMDETASRGEAEDILRHELAHVARWDDWGNLLQQTIQGALFFHPAAWWISGELALEREIACDDHVLEASGRPRDYALTLANVASRMSQCRPLLAPGVLNNNSQLQKRITMILNTHRDRSPRLAKSRLGFFTSATALLAVLAINAGPRLVLAQSAPSPAPKAEASVSPGPDGDDSDPRFKVDAPEAATVVCAGTVAAPALEAQVADVAPSAQVAELVAVSGAHTMALEAPEAPEPPEPPEAQEAPEAPEPPEAPEAPEAGLSKSHLSVEQRLERIERTLERLQARMEKSQHRIDSFSGGQGHNMAHGAAWSWSGDDFGAKRMADDAKRMADDAKRQAEDGKRQAEMAMRDIAKFNANDFGRMQKDKLDAEANASRAELQALRSARQSLDREMGNLDRQIQRLEQDMVKLKKDVQKNHSDDADDAPKAKTIQKD